MEKVVLVMIVAPFIGHLTQALEMAKIMLERNHQISITVLIMEVPSDTEGTSKIQSLIDKCNVERLHFHHLPTPEDTSQWDRGTFVVQLTDYQKPHVREVVSNIKDLSGIIIDLSNAAMIDIADELGVPSYLFFTSGAGYLGLLLHFQALADEHDQELPELVKTETQLVVPTFASPVPINVLPTSIIMKDLWSIVLKWVRAYRRVKSIMVNTFADLETYHINSFSLEFSYGKSAVPPIYPVGPILNSAQIQTQSTKDPSEMMNWLDDQPPNSVAFLCFGSQGRFHLSQVQEIANGLERSGYRFIWVLRRPRDYTGEYENHELVLPQGFLDRTASIGKVMSWVPQLDVLSHSAVGGFVSHCGWNSILESIFCGVPIATLPLYAEQQLNAFQLVKELKMAVEISLDYDQLKENQAVIKAEQIEKGIRTLMDGENEVRKRVKEFSEKSKLAMKEGGSSYLSWHEFIQSICS